MIKKAIYFNIETIVHLCLIIEIMISAIISGALLCIAWYFSKPLCRYIEQGKEDDSDLNGRL